MRRIVVTGGLAVFAGMFALPGSVGPTHAPATAAVPQVDKRLINLQGFFQKRDCPARKYASDFLWAADLYSLDWRLLPSISFVESTGGKAARNNNLFGWNSGNTRFPSVRASIHEVARKLAHSKPYRGKTLVNKLLTYNPRAEYAQRVLEVMQAIHPSESVAE